MSTTSSPTYTARNLAVRRKVIIPRRSRRCCLPRYEVSSSDSENADPESPRRSIVRRRRRKHRSSRFNHVAPSAPHNSINYDSGTSTDHTIEFLIEYEQGGTEWQTFGGKKGGSFFSIFFSPTDSTSSSMTPSVHCVSSPSSGYANSSSESECRLSYQSDLELGSCNELSQRNIKADVVCESDLVPDSSTPSLLLWSSSSLDLAPRVSREPIIYSKTDSFKNVSIIDERNNGSQSNSKYNFIRYCKPNQSSVISSVNACELKFDDLRHHMWWKSWRHMYRRMIMKKFRLMAALLEEALLDSEALLIFDSWLCKNIDHEDASEGSQPKHTYLQLSAMKDDIVQTVSYKYTDNNILTSPLPAPEYFHNKATMINYDQKDYKQFLVSVILDISPSVSRDIASSNAPAEDDSLSAMLYLDIDTQSISHSSVGEESCTTNSRNLCTENSTGSGAYESDYCQRKDNGRIQLRHTRILGARPYHLMQQHMQQACSWIYVRMFEDSSEEDEYSLKGFGDDTSSSPVYINRKKRRVIPMCHCHRLKLEYHEDSTSTSSD